MFSFSDAQVIKKNCTHQHRRPIFLSKINAPEPDKSFNLYAPRNQKITNFEGFAIIELD